VKEAEDHRSRAALCVTLAATTDDEVIKAALTDMARKWRELADRSDLAEPPPSPSGNLLHSAGPAPRSAGTNDPPPSGASAT
jgi:hypothetical protein